MKNLTALLSRLSLGLMLLAVGRESAAQNWYPAIPGFDVGLHPAAAIAVTTYAGQPAFWMVVPAKDPIASFHDPRLLPIGALKVSLKIAEWGVYEPQPCAVGARMFFDTQSNLSTTPSATLAAPGLSFFGAGPYPLAFAPFDGLYSNWKISYCDVSTCTSPCGPAHRTPQWAAYLFVPSFS